MSELNEGRHQVKRKYGDHGRIRINENGAKVRETIVKFVGKNYVTEEDLHNHLIRLEEDRGGVKVNKAKWFARNQKLFTTFEKKGTTYYSLSKYGMRVLELINSKTVKKALNESSFKNIPSLSEWIATNESEVNEAKMAETSHMKEMYEMMTDMYEMMEKMHEGEHEMKATSDMYEKMCEMHEMMKETYEGYGK